MSQSLSISLANLEYIARYKDIDPVRFSGHIKDINRYIKEELGGHLKISIIFVKNDYIRRLNKEYREIDEVTDVLSFNIDDENNEVYVSPAYIYQSYRRGIFVEELLRMIIHGILHIYGYDHQSKFDEEESDEEMFKIQEDILHKVMKK